MAKEKIISNGICAFCGQSFPKNAIKRHLNACQARKTALEQDAKKKKAVKSKFFHLLVEGKYHPEYWMHLEMPVDATLSDLDIFLRGIWLECCGHLSAFRIGETSYDSHPDEDAFFPASFMDVLPVEMPSNVIPLFPDANPPATMPPPPIMIDTGMPQAPIDMDDESINDFVNEFFEKYEHNPEALVGMSAETLMSKFSTEFLQEVGITPFPNGANPFTAFINIQVKMYSGKDIKQLSAAELITIMNEMDSIISAMNDLLDDDDFAEDMDVALAEVLKVGDKFEHEYDFGSTTTLKLKVLSEREGIVVGKNKKNYAPVTLLARNEAPAVVCADCSKKPAKWICTNCNWGGGSGIGWVCDDCVRNHEEDMILPVVNSPRAGVCGYTGDAEAYPLENGFVIYLEDQFDFGVEEDDDGEA